MRLPVYHGGKLPIVFRNIRLRERVVIDAHIEDLDGAEVGNAVARRAVFGVDAKVFSRSQGIWNVAVSLASNQFGIHIQVANARPGVENAGIEMPTGILAGIGCRGHIVPWSFPIG